MTKRMGTQKGNPDPAPRIAYVHNFATHYTAPLFGILGRRLNIDFYFFSDGGERYWLAEHGVRAGEFRCEYLPGFRIFGTRITPTLPWKLIRGRYQAVIKCINGRFALPATLLTARLMGVPFVLYSGIWCRFGTPAHRLLFPLTRYIYRHADAIVAYGPHVKEYLVSEGVRAERIFLAYHAVDSQQYSRPVAEGEIRSLRAKHQVAPGDKIVLYLGRLAEGKGLEYLLDAFGSLNRRETVLLLAGEGNLHPALQARARQLGVEGLVRFAGYVRPEEAAAYYAVAWFCVLPSVTTPTFKEPWGLVVNEAMNQGTPVVTTDAVGAAAGGLVQDGVNGFVVPESDSAALAKAMAALLDNSELRARMSQAARSEIAQWTQERQAEGYIQALEFVLGRKVEVPGSLPLNVAEAGHPSSGD